MWAAAGAGFFLGFSLILAIGAQNAFVLRQGLKGQHVLAVVLACALSDAVLIVAGVLGFGAVLAVLPWLEAVLRWGGVLFLCGYGLKSLLSAFGPSEHLDPAKKEAEGLGQALVTCLALTWLNPHVYLDTLVLMGSISTGYGADAKFFAAGAVVSSFLFFFSLGYGASLLRPVFAAPLAWRVLDFGVAVVMLSLALGLAISA